MRTQIDVGMLGAALIGYQCRLEQVKEKIQEIQGKLGGRTAAINGEPARAPKHRISAAGRARIAAAQRKRWAAAKKAKAA